MSNIDMSQRCLLPEVMDQPDLDAELHRGALAGLARINYFSRSARILWPVVRDVAHGLQRPLRLLDIASGGGDVAIHLWRMCRQAGISVEITGVDVSPLATSYACQRVKTAGAPITFLELNALQDPLPGQFDVTTSSLFLHHLQEAEAVALLRRISAATEHAVAINDLRRSRAGYALAQLACRVLTRSPVVRVDGPRSVAGAFTESELAAVFEKAGMKNVSIRRKWPCRMLAMWKAT